MCEPQICRTDIVELDPSLFSTFNTSLNHFGLTSQSCKDMQQVNVRTYIYIYNIDRLWEVENTGHTTYVIMLLDMCWIDLLCYTY